MSYISHDLKRAIVTWKNDTYEPSDQGPWTWPFKEDVPQATVVAVFIYDTPGASPEPMLVLKAPNGDLATFISSGARIVTPAGDDDLADLRRRVAKLEAF